MPKQQPEITLHMQEDLLRKLLYVANAEGRSPNNHLIMLLRNNVQYFERPKDASPQTSCARSTSRTISPRRTGSETE